MIAKVSVFEFALLTVSACWYAWAILQAYHDGWLGASMLVTALSMAAGLMLSKAARRVKK